MSRLPRTLLSRLSSIRARQSPDWVCTSCRRNSSTTSAQKPFYVTSPIFYVNAAPHVGHLYSMVLADVLKRWALLRGNKAYLTIGTDEHGLKVQQAAQKAGVNTQEFCDTSGQIFQQLAAKAQISNDFFARTTDHKHKNAVQYAWIRLRDQGYIYEDKHQGWYSVADETFYPESRVILSIDPLTRRKIQVSQETGSRVELQSETNYKFRLSKFQDQLLEFYEKNPDWIIPAARMNAVVNEVKGGLSDLSISRPSQRVQWGIPVPDDPSQTIYVWLDALLNYPVQVGYPNASFVQDGAWPADVHVIGKDILRFHCIYWPAFLMALDLPLPRKVLSHAHWTLGQSKMSKSTGNVVDPFLSIERYGIDALRWYLVHDGGIADDSDYHNDRIDVRYRHLSGSLGNMVSRLVRAKHWSVKTAVKKIWATPDGVNEIKSDDDHIAMFNALTALECNVAAAVDKHDIKAALVHIMTTIDMCNVWFQNLSPWHEPDPDPPHNMTPKLTSTVGLAAEILRVCGIYLQPYMPGKASSMLDILGVDEDRRTWDHAKVGSDKSFGVSKVPRGVGFKGVLFPPIPFGKR